MWVPREGWLCLLVAAAVALIGALKGITLLLLLGAVLGTACGLNAVAAGRRLRALRLRRWLPEAVFAGTPFAVEVEVANPTAAARYGLRLEDRGPDHSQAWFVPRLDAGAAARFRGQVTLPRRGPYAWEAFRAVTGSPFGLVEARIRLAPDGAVVVFPRLGTLHRGLFRLFLQQGTAVDRRARRQRPAPHPAAQSDLHGVRAFRNGDSPRWIHWRTSARRGELMVREFEESPTDNLTLVVDPWVPATGGHNPDPALEEALSLAATVCWQWCRQTGDHLALAVAGRTPAVVTGVTGRGLALEALGHLAREPGTPSPDVPALLARLASAELPPAPVLLVSTRPDSFGDQLAGGFQRPVAFVDVTDPTGYEFYEGSADHAP
jgi:uncharacterized protein (DUF58 family)